MCRLPGSDTARGSDDIIMQVIIKETKIDNAVSNLNKNMFSFILHLKGRLLLISKDV